MQSDNPFVHKVSDVLTDITAACDRSSRDTAGVQLIAVTKTVGPGAVMPLLDAGVKHLAENRWQQAREKIQLPDSHQATWHFIGRLQSNKVKYVVPYFDWIHSVDSLTLAEEISKRAVQAGKTLNCLIQVNTSGESSKAGIHPEEVEPLLKQIYNLPAVSVRGLMTMAPHFESPELTRPVFQRLRHCLEDTRQHLGLSELSELSMGMSNDFEIAVEEGATMVRVGRRIMDAWSEPTEE